MSPQVDLEVTQELPVLPVHRHTIDRTEIRLSSTGHYLYTAYICRCRQETTTCCSRCRQVVWSKRCPKCQRQVP